MRYLPLLLIILLASCRTTKNTQTTRIITDSTVERALREQNSMLEAELRAASRDSAIRYVTDVVFEECDSTEAPATVVFDNGKLASVTGQLRSVRQQLSEEVAERYAQASIIDSQRAVIDSMNAHKSVEYVDKVIEVKRSYIPWWVWAALGLLGLLLLRAHLPRIIDFFKPKTYSMFPLFLLGTWPIGLLLLAGACIFFYFAYRARQSGWKQQDPKTGRTYYGDEKLPYSKIGQFWFGVVCVVGFLAYLLIQIGER